ncbi:MAG: hypothetical protein L0154_19200 [Chloroflexi bacterium]|nr:hypothetical protein [Chloroflexota bacterium]
MPDNSIIPYFGRYLRLHGLHLVEEKVTSEVVLRVRVAATRYITSVLPIDLENRWINNPAQGVEEARDLMMPRLDALRNVGDEAWEALNLIGQDPRWDTFRQQRQLGQNSLPGVNLPAVPRSLFPIPISPLTRRLDNLTRFLHAVHTGIMIADSAAKLWYDWRLGQENVRIMQARRLLLEDALGAAGVSQEYALKQALDPTNVERYLTAGGDDPAYDILFSDDD